MRVGVGDGSFDGWVGFSRHGLGEAAWAEVYEGLLEEVPEVARTRLSRKHLCFVVDDQGECDARVASGG
jgi:hypothetical protein